MRYGSPEQITIDSKSMSFNFIACASFCKFFQTCNCRVDTPISLNQKSFCPAETVVADALLKTRTVYIFVPKKK